MFCSSHVILDGNETHLSKPSNILNWEMLIPNHRLGTEKSGMYIAGNAIWI